jgi:ABC-type oligopeptide transport system substrate-binding subunit
LKSASNVLFRKWLKLLILCLFSGINSPAKGQHKMLTQEKPDLEAFLGPLPQNIDPTTVTSFTEYVIIKQLTRGLVHLDSAGQLTGDLAENWKISGGSKSFKFKLKPNKRFSNGDLITAKDVVGSIQRQMKKGRTIHFDFNNISSIKELNELELEINLKKPDILFISKLEYPEFGVLHNSDYLKQFTQQCDWKVTSGRTILNKKEASSITLKEVGPTPRTITLANTAPLNEQLNTSKIDFFVGIPPLSANDHKAASKEFDAYSPRLSFTYFLSFGARSPFIKEEKLRVLLLSRLYDFQKSLEFSSPFHTRAKQLYLADGPGRTTQERIYEIQKIHLKSEETNLGFEKLKILVQKSFPYTKELTKFLASKGIQSEVFLYANFDEFDKIRSSEAIDLIQSNNDFSASDLTSNILVTLNKERPLIEANDDKIIEKLATALESESDERIRISSIQKIEDRLLSTGLVFPLFHFNMFFYVSKKRNSNQLSRNFPEVALWKIR